MKINKTVITKFVHNKNCKMWYNIPSECCVRIHRVISYRIKLPNAK